MARSRGDARGKREMADPLAMDPLATMAYMVARDRLQERLEPAPRPDQASASSKRDRGWRDRAAGRLRGMADRLEPAGVQSRG